MLHCVAVRIQRCRAEVALRAEVVEGFLEGESAVGHIFYCCRKCSVLSETIDLSMPEIGPVFSDRCRGGSRTAPTGFVRPIDSLTHQHVASRFLRPSQHQSPLRMLNHLLARPEHGVVLPFEPGLDQIIVVWASQVTGLTRWRDGDRT